VTVCKSAALTTYEAGPIAEPCIMLAVMHQIQTPLGELTALPDPLAGGMVWLPLPKNPVPLSTLQTSILVVQFLKFL